MLTCQTHESLPTDSEMAGIYITILQAKMTHANIMEKTPVWMAFSIIQVPPKEVSIMIHKKV